MFGALCGMKQTSKLGPRTIFDLDWIGTGPRTGAGTCQYKYWRYVQNLAVVDHLVVISFFPSFTSRLLGLSTFYVEI